MQKRLRINNRIRIAELQVIGADGSQLGTMKTPDALKAAQEQGLDLVEVNPNSRPPLAKIMDYGKYMYTKEKQEKQSPKSNKDQDLKIIKIGFKTGAHDLKFKASKVDKFINAGHPVKLDIFLRGRERSRSDMAKGVLEKFLEYISEPYTIQNNIKRIPSGWTMLIKKGKQQLTSK